jgi:hypothetical protein
MDGNVYEVGGNDPPERTQMTGRYFQDAPAWSNEDNECPCAEARSQDCALHPTDPSDYDADEKQDRYAEAFDSSPKTLSDELRRNFARWFITSSWEIRHVELAFAEWTNRIASRELDRFGKPRPVKTVTA